MSAKIKNIERKWIGNFMKSPLVDPHSGLFLSNYAHQLFYGRQDETYPRDFPDDFIRLYKTWESGSRDKAVEKFISYLHFIGISIRKEAVANHLNKFPDDLQKLAKTCYYILKTLAHFAGDLNLANPFHDNSLNLFFLLRIESGESVTDAQLSLFEDLELPDLYSRFSGLPEGYEKDPVVKDLFDRIENSKDSFFITGKAGTGKSTFIHYFAKKTKKRVLMTAFTGIAAINVGGQTIHSFFRLPLKPLMPEDDEITLFPKNTPKYRIIQKIDAIVIDEISMLRSDILEAIDYSLRKNGGDPGKRFGGKQILFVGDIFQLPPVRAINGNVEQILFSEVYASEYFFDSPAFQEIKPQYFEFRKSHRQKDDLLFVSLLDKVRTYEADRETLFSFNERYDPDYLPGTDEFVIKLTANNTLANVGNFKKLQELPYTSFNFSAGIEGEFQEDKFPTSKNLELKKSAQVIFVRNDPARRWVNGTIAKIDFISGDLIEVRLQDGNVYPLEPATWENRRYKYDRKKRKVVSEVIGTFTQYPVKLAWAITIHKSQGLTFDHVVIDLGAGAFVNGQVYTALSRCRKLNGIVLKRKLRPEDLITDKRIIEFHRRNSPQCIDDLLKLDIPFAIRLLSLYYPFSAAELDRYWNRLEKGDAHYSVFINETGTVYTPATGLCFNQSLEWTDGLRSRWNAGLVNPLTGNMEGIGSAPAGKGNSDLSKQLLPLNLKRELKFRNKAINEHWCAVIAPKQDWESDAAFEEPKLLPMEKFGKEFERLGFEPFKQLYETDKTLLLYNDSIWRNTLKELMTKERVHELLTFSMSVVL
ncbi:MAG: ATP-dependent RecD-like DNA helicase [Mangrovibacterium sp.]